MPAQTLVAALCLGLCAVGLATKPAPARDVAPVEPLLDDSVTVLGQPLVPTTFMKEGLHPQLPHPLMRWARLKRPFGGRQISRVRAPAQHL